MTAIPRKATDWERIETLYRAGTMSVREIAEQVGVSHTAVNKRAKAEGWTRDLRAKVQAQADALVSRDMVSTEVSASALATEKLVVEVEAQVQARIRLSHRSDIQRSRRLTMTLLEELENQTGLGPELAALGRMMAAPDEKSVDKLNELYHKVISLPSRTKVLKDLGDTLKTLIGLEREAYALADNPDDKPELAEQLAQFVGALHENAAGRLPIAKQKAR